MEKNRTFSGGGVMETREEMKVLLKQTIENLKSFANEFEELLNEMDGLSDEEFNKKSEEITDKYSEFIELF